MTLIDLFLHLSWQLLDTAFPKQKKCRQQLLLLQVFCVKLILRSKLQISDLKIWTFLNLEWLCKSLWTFSLMMWFLPTLKGSQPYKVPTQSRSSIHPTLFLKLFVVTDCKFWTDWPVLSASKVFFLTHHHHFKTLWPKKSQLFSRCFMSSWCLFDGVGRLFQDCFLYLLHTQNNDRALQKTFFSSLNGLLDHQTLWLYSLVMGNWNSIILSNFFCLVLWKVKAWPTKFWKYVVIIQVF